LTLSLFNREARTEFVARLESEVVAASAPASLGAHDARQQPWRPGPGG